MPYSDDPHVLFEQIKGQAASMTKLTGGNATRRTAIVGLATHGLGVTATPVPPPIEPPVPTSILWGARMDGEHYGRSDAPWDLGTWDLFERHAGKKVTLCSFGQPPPWVQAFAAGPFNNCRTRGAVPVCDMGTGTASLASIAFGQFDASLQAWGQAARAWGGRIILRWCWEMSGTWFSWGAQAKANPADYVNAWRRARQAMAAPNVEWCWCPNVVFSGSTPLASLYPGDAYVEHLGMDGYNWGTNPTKPAGWLTFDQVFKPTYTQLAALSPRPMMINEFASSEIGGSKPAWITDAFHRLPAYPRIRAVSWFNWNADGMDWAVETSAAATQAFASAVADPYLKAA